MHDQCIGEKDQFSNNKLVNFFGNIPEDLTLETPHYCGLQQDLVGGNILAPIIFSIVKKEIQFY